MKNQPCIQFNIAGYAAKDGREGQNHHSLCSKSCGQVTIGLKQIYLHFPLADGIFSYLRYQSSVLKLGLNQTNKCEFNMFGANHFLHGQLRRISEKLCIKGTAFGYLTPFYFFHKLYLCPLRTGKKDLRRYLQNSHVCVVVDNVNTDRNSLI